MSIVNIRFDASGVDITHKSGLHGHANFGNPFGTFKHREYALVVETHEEAILCYEAWLRGEAFDVVRPEQRKWILEHLHELKGQTLCCYCPPKICHGEVLQRLIEELS